MSISEARLGFSFLKVFCFFLFRLQTEHHTNLFSVGKRSIDTQKYFKLLTAKMNVSRTAFPPTALVWSGIISRIAQRSDYRSKREQFQWPLPEVLSLPQSGVCSLPPWHLGKDCEDFLYYLTVYFFRHEREEKEGEQKSSSQPAQLQTSAPCINGNLDKSRAERGTWQAGGKGDGALHGVQCASFHLQIATSECVRSALGNVSCDSSREGFGCQFSLYPPDSRLGCEV